MAIAAGDGVALTTMGGDAQLLVLALKMRDSFVICVRGVSARQIRVAAKSSKCGT